MHPNVYLRTFWRGTFRPEVFVAMSFGDAYLKRFTEVIEPAVKAVTHNGKQLRARRVDLSKSGDLILTDIIDGVAHSAMILADVSVVGHDSKTGEPCRNGNVMYEVGLALACRQPREVLLVRDDKAPFLFDVSTVPHKHIEFSDVGKARTDLANELVARLREVDHLRDARLVVALASLTSQERVILARFSKYGLNQRFWLKQSNLGTLAAIPRLLDKGLIRTAGVTEDEQAVFAWTELGHAVATRLDEYIPVVRRAVETSDAVDKPADPTGDAA